MTGLDNKKFGFVALLGPTNAGKSTLMNRLVGSKVSIVSHKVQTTRSRIIGIVIKDNAEIAFIDSAGIFTPKNRLSRAMVAGAWQAPESADKTLVVIDGNKKISDNVKLINERLQKQGKSFVVAFNKIDGADKSALLERSAYFSDNELCEKLFFISALKGAGCDDLLHYLASTMPDGEWQYDPDQLTDMPNRLFAAEITREAAFRYLHQELPYGLTVESEAWEEVKDHIIISQVIFVEKSGHKGIVLGKGGSTIKRIGINSRRQLEKILGKKINLRLFVKHRSNWQNDPERYREWNLDF